MIHVSVSVFGNSHLTQDNCASVNIFQYCIFIIQYSSHLSVIFHTENRILVFSQFLRINKAPGMVHPESQYVDFFILQCSLAKPGIYVSIMQGKESLSVKHICAYGNSRNAN